MTAHLHQSLALFFFLSLIVIVVVGLVAVLSYGMVYHRHLTERWPTEAWLLSLGRKLLIAWGVFWAYAIVRALRGSAVPVPYLTPFLRLRLLRYGGFGALCTAYLVFLAAVLVIVAAESAITHEEDRGSVFMVYDDLNRFPRAIFSAAMYPITRAAVARYGDGSAVLLPISASAIQTAATHGTFVVIASHGTANGLLLSEGYFVPSDVPPLAEEARLRFVYLAGCDSGAQREAWEAAFYPATVKTYDRLTPVIEHLWWFWTEGPKVVRNLPDEKVATDG